MILQMAALFAIPGWLDSVALTAWARSCCAKDCLVHQHIRNPLHHVEVSDRAHEMVLTLNLAAVISVGWKKDSFHVSLCGSWASGFNWVIGHKKGVLIHPQLIQMILWSSTPMESMK